MIIAHHDDRRKIQINFRELHGFPALRSAVYGGQQVNRAGAERIIKHVVPRAKGRHLQIDSQPGLDNPDIVRRDPGVVAIVVQKFEGGIKWVDPQPDRRVIGQPRPFLSRQLDRRTGLPG